MEKYKKFFAEFKDIEVFLRIDIDIVRDFKNRKTGRFEIDGQGFYIKKHFAAGLGAVLDELSHFRKPHIGAGYEKLALEKLKELGVDTMEVVAFGSDGKSLASQRSFLVTKELINVESLEDTCRNWPTELPVPKFKRKLLTKMASIAKTLHDNGMNHRDFYICHFLLDVTGGPEKYLNCEPRLFLIDLHRAQIREKVPFRWLVKDIGGLYFSAMDIGLTRADFCRFIKVYTGKLLRETFTEDKSFWQAVQARAVKTYRRDFKKEPENLFTIYPKGMA
ncbi:MAG: lipopolysaccharide core heptose(I) kinase RfaP [Phycisphaerae bacterium]|nr:lipopolysaccharide core heptose(I) kinase RfaP [Phycisphaerae bacterium]